MKGLLIKDFRLLKCQKNFFVILMLIVVAMSAYVSDPAFIIGYMTFIVSLFALSSVSYDEFDNGNAFLFSLPISKKKYVIEKYCFGLLLGGGAWILSILLVGVTGLIKGVGLTRDIMVIAILVFAAMIIILSIMLPFQLKFGGEKGRIAMIGAIGLVMVLAFSIKKITELMEVNLVSLINSLPTMSTGMVSICAVGVAVVVLLISVKISLSIMNRKEF